MIHVQPQPEPEGFHKDVRLKGHRWLRSHGMALDDEPPKASDLPPLWRKYNEHLWQVYGGVCAYFAFFFDLPTGATTTDHFIAKSRHAGGAYEWNNYRLACMRANQQKQIYDDILDPFIVSDDTFVIAFETGEVTVSPDLVITDPTLDEIARRTIERLDLNCPYLKRVRTEYFDAYISGHISECYLQKKNPFVYHEAKRQGYLKHS